MKMNLNEYDIDEDLPQTFSVVLLNTCLITKAACKKKKFLSTALMSIFMAFNFQHVYKPSNTYSSTGPVYQNRLACFCFTSETKRNVSNSFILTHIQ